MRETANINWWSDSVYGYVWIVYGIFTFQFTKQNQPNEGTVSMPASHVSPETRTKKNSHFHYTGW